MIVQSTDGSAFNDILEIFACQYKMIFPNLYDVIVCMYCNLCNQFFIDEYLGYFKSFVITDNVTVNKPVNVLFLKHGS